MTDGKTRPLQSDEEVASLLGTSPRRRAVGGSPFPPRGQISMACLVLGLVATMALFSVRKAAEAPGSEGWMQSLANLEGTGDPHAAADAAAETAGNNVTMMRFPKLAEEHEEGEAPSASSEGRSPDDDEPGGAEENPEQGPGSRADQPDDSTSSSSAAVSEAPTAEAPITGDALASAEAPAEAPRDAQVQETPIAPESENDEATPSGAPPTDDDVNDVDQEAAAARAQAAESLSQEDQLAADRARDAAKIASDAAEEAERAAAEEASDADEAASPAAAAAAAAAAEDAEASAVGAKEEEESPTPPPKDSFRCDMAPHERDDDHFKCSLVLFNETDLTRGKSRATPKWPGADLFKPTMLPTELRVEVNRCRRSAQIAPEAGELDRPYVLTPHGREKHFTAGAVFEETAAAAAAAAARASAREAAAASLAAAEEDENDGDAEEGEHEAETAAAAAEEDENDGDAGEGEAETAAADDATAGVAARLGDGSVSSLIDDFHIDDDDDAEGVQEEYADAVASLGDGPSPPDPARNATNSAYMYAFLHIHKCGGTFVESQMQAAADANVDAFGQDAKAIYAPLFGRYPLLELLTPEVYKFMAWHYHHRVPENVYGGDALRNSFRRGHRMFVKSSEAMGFCDFVDAPCMYVTVLREPVSRFMSFYSYTCLVGAEGRKHWPQEWIDAGECALDPMQFAAEVLSDGFSMIDLLAPGGDQRAGCRVEAAKLNLVSGCMRYLLLELLDHGFEQVRRTLPDLAQVGLREATEAENDSSGRLTEAQRARLAGYAADQEMMQRVRHFLQDDTDVYRYAVQHYQEQWSKPLETC